MRTGKKVAYRIGLGRRGPRPRPRDGCSCLQRHDAAALNNFPPRINAPLRAKAGVRSFSNGENPSARIRAMRHQALSDKRSPVKRERAASPSPRSVALLPHSARLPPGRRKSQRIYRWFLCFRLFLTVSIAVAADVLMCRQYVSDSDFVARTIRIR